MFSSLYPGYYDHPIFFLDIFMTCIVAISDNGKVYMGGDRGHSDSHTLVSSTQPKIFDTGSYLIGYAGNSGIGQAVVYNFQYPAVGKTHNIDRHMLKVFIPALRLFFKENDIKIPDDDDNNAGFIVGVKGRVYEIDISDFQCVEYEEVSIGSGSSYAYGSLYTSIDLPAKARVEKALQAAINYSPTCKAPIDILYK
jgi:ATP-dependent protease HslVU (ClpYQ) peptidase subunit